MKYRHYAPRAPMFIVQGSEAFFRETIEAVRAEGQRMGILVVEERAQTYEADVVVTCGTYKDAASIAKRLYDALREMDQADVDVIYCESFAETGDYEAIMNRLRKASGYRVIEEPRHE